MQGCDLTTRFLAVKGPEAAIALMIQTALCPHLHDEKSERSASAAATEHLRPSGISGILHTQQLPPQRSPEVWRYRHIRNQTSQPVQATNQQRQLPVRNLEQAYSENRDWMRAVDGPSRIT